jgi:hypothetical protein
MEEIILIGKKQDLIDIIESHIAYLLASGYDNSDNQYYSNSELNICYNFLMQLDESSKFLQESK